MSDDKVYYVKIKNGEIDLKFKRTDIIEIKQSHDGMVFNLKEGMHIVVADGYMNLETKQKIITAFDRFKNSNISINLKNYSTPATVEVI